MHDLMMRDSEEEIISRLKRNGYYIDSVEKTPDRCMIAVKQNGGALRNIPKEIQTVELCLEAVRNNGEAVKYVSKKLLNEEICLEAVKNDGNAVYYIPTEFLSYKLYIKAVKQDGMALRFIDPERRTKEICMLSVSQDGRAFEYVPDSMITKEICHEAVKQNGIALKFMVGNRKSEILCMKALESNALALAYVPDRFKTKEVCLAAVKKDWRAFAYLPKNLYSISLCEEFIKKLINDVNLEDYSVKNCLENIVSNFPAEINKEDKIIKLERCLGTRRFTLKKYNKEKNKFITKEKICYEEEEEIKEYETFNEFYTYLDGDLNGADLYDYDFNNIDLHKYDIKDAFINSKVLVSQNLYDDTFYNENIKKYNSEATLMLSESNEIVKAGSMVHEYSTDNDLRKIYYISDIHLDHKIIKRFPKYATKQEIKVFIRTFIKKMVDSATEKNYDDYLLIAGDVSYNYEISKIFYSELAKLWYPHNIITILGNHELWNFNRNGVTNDDEILKEDVISKYRDLFSSLEICFLENELLILQGYTKQVLTKEQLNLMSVEEIKNICLKSSLIILGGLGFSGYCSEFNALNGIYRDTINTLEDDVKYTKEFENTYNKINASIGDRNVIVLTHTPKENWSEKEYNSSWIYVNGHTHRNNFACDEKHTVYADNQVGYTASIAGLNYFCITNKYDTFYYYGDGIYDISREQYLDFAHGANMTIQFNRVNGKIHMLKNQGIYCFIYEKDNTGKLYLLDGGRTRLLKNNNLEYYFNGMVYYASAVKENFGAYYDALNRISNSIKKIGGSGKVHGCIVDIDCLNHIYLNPDDGKVSAYYALSIVDKFKYKDIVTLLKKNTPKLYDNYKKLIEDKWENSLDLKKNINTKVIEMPQYIADTLMYRKSNSFRTVQYLIDVNVIRIWNDDFINNQMNSKGAVL